MRPSGKKALMISVTATILAIIIFSAFMIIQLLHAEKKATDEYQAIALEYTNSPDFEEENEDDAVGGIRLAGDERQAGIDTAGSRYDIEELQAEYEESKAPFDPVPEPHPDHKALAAQNPDYVCWIWVPGTRVSYPVVSYDDEWYTNHSFLGTDSPAGAIFIGQHSDTVTYIYGHNMHDLTMFGSLRRASTMDGVTEVHMIYPSGDKVYRIVSAHTTLVGGDVYSQPASGADLRQFVSSQAKSSDRNYTDIPQDPTDVLVLSTCYGITGGTGRFVMVAAR